MRTEAARSEFPDTVKGPDATPRKYPLRGSSDAAQERGEVRRPNNEKTASGVEAVSVADIGLTHEDIHEARGL